MCLHHKFYNWFYYYYYFFCAMLLTKKNLHWKIKCKKREWLKKARTNLKGDVGLEELELTELELRTYCLGDECRSTVKWVSRLSLDNDSSYIVSWSNCELLMEEFYLAIDLCSSANYIEDLFIQGGTSCGADICFEYCVLLFRITYVDFEKNGPGWVWTRDYLFRRWEPIKRIARLYCTNDSSYSCLLKLLG